MFVRPLIRESWNSGLYLASPRIVSGVVPVVVGTELLHMFAVPFDLLETALFPSPKTLSATSAITVAGLYSVPTILGLATTLVGVLRRLLS